MYWDATFSGRTVSYAGRFLRYNFGNRIYSLDADINVSPALSYIVVK